MPDVSKTITALQQVAEAVGKAQAATAQFDARAHQVQNRVGGQGFRKMADRLGSARERLKPIRDMQTGVAATTKSTVELVQRVTDDMSPAGVEATLSPAAKQVGSASTAASASTAQLDNLAAEIADILRGGKPGPLVGLVNQIKQATVQVSAGLDKAKATIEETIEAVREAGNF